MAKKGWLSLHQKSGSIYSRIYTLFQEIENNFSIAVTSNEVEEIKNVFQMIGFW